MTAAPQSSLEVENLNLPEADLTGDYLSYTFRGEDGSVSGGTVLFCAPKHFRFRDPRLSVRREGGELVVIAEAYARAVEIRSEDPDLVLEDNFFDMNPGERRIRILRGTAENPRVRSVFDIA